MNSKKKNLIIGGVTIVVIISIIIGIYLYMKKIRHEKKIQHEQQLKNAKDGIDEVYAKMKKQKDIQDDAAGKLAREKYEKSGVKTLAKDTTNVEYKENVSSVWDDPDGSSTWDDEY